ncbi:MAG TPA: hypothetical protein PL096_03460 [Micropepsaceae bacterium]|nr:hypothetical protein [Micropepsaceae bacterium]
MIEPEDLISQAETLVAQGRGAPRQAALRRAVSNAYYALFHTIIRRCAQELAGSDSSKAEYRLVYRSIDHNRVKEICQEVANPKLGTKFTKFLGNATFGRELRATASSFARLHAERHVADYDPAPERRFNKERVLDSIKEASAAVAAFNSASALEVRLFVFLINFKLRP